MTAAMAINALAEQRFLLSGVLWLASFIYYSGHYYQKRTGNFQLSANIILYSLLILMAWLVYSGGKDNTGPLWIFMVAPVALFFGGLKRGMANISLFIPKL